MKSLYYPDIRYPLGPVRPLHSENRPCEEAEMPVPADNLEGAEIPERKKRKKPTSKTWKRDKKRKQGDVEEKAPAKPPPEPKPAKAPPRLDNLNRV